MHKEIVQWKMIADKFLSYLHKTTLNIAIRMQIKIAKCKQYRAYRWRSISTGTCHGT